MNMRVSGRLEGIQPFRVMGLLARAEALAAQGHDVIHMEVGEPDFPTPEPVVSAGEAALAAGKTRYTPALGISALREAISRYYATDYGLDLDPARIVVTAGGSGALLLASAVLVDPGDGILMADPAYPCNRQFIKCFGGEAQLVAVTPEDNYQLNAGMVAGHWRPNTRGVLLASPSNPTGAVIPSGELIDIASEVRARHGVLLVDEIYHGLAYQPEGASSILQFDDHAIVVNSFSKYFGMTGWRLGWLVAPEALIPDIEKLAQNLFICPSSLAQYAALAAFEPASRCIMDAQRDEFRVRRDFLVGALRDIGFVVPNLPDGAFYVYAQLPPGYSGSEAFCERLLEEFHIAVTPGTDFGEYLAQEHVRFSYAQPVPRMAEGVERIATALERWRRS